MYCPVLFNRLHTAHGTRPLVQMCCEQLECHVAVFDHTEAVCYLKGAGATHTYDFVKQEGFSAFEMLIREGKSDPTEKAWRPALWADMDISAASCLCDVSPRLAGLSSCACVPLTCDTLLHLKIGQQSNDAGTVLCCSESESAVPWLERCRADKPLFESRCLPLVLRTNVEYRRCQ